MGWMRFLRRGHWERECARELDAHLAIETDENIARGMAPDAARLAARRKLGNRTRVLEEIHDMNTIAPLDMLWQDLRYALRGLRLNPGFAAVAVLSLALGIGANTAMFQLLDAVRLRTLPVDNPRALVDLRIESQGRSGSFAGRFPRFTNPIYEQLRDRHDVFSGLAAWGTRRFNLVSGGEARYAEGLWVSGNFFDVLGIRARVGRLFTPADDTRGCAPGVVVSHAFWQRELGGQMTAIGRPLLLDGRAFDVIGVTPPGFFGVEVGRAFDVAVPLCADPLFSTTGGRLDVRQAWWLALLGRLAPGRTLDQANAQLRSLSKVVFEATLPPSYQVEDARSYRAFVLYGTEASTGISGLRERFENPLFLLLATTGVVLLIACANLASLLLARASAREQEMAVRLAIGASRRRLIRQLLVESLLVASIGAASGLLVARLVSRALVAALSTGRSPLFVDLRLDWRVAAFTAVTACLTCLLFGVAPALRATRTAPAEAIRSQGRGLTTKGAGLGLRRSLVVTQIALSLVLVLGALLFVRTLHNLMTAETGFSSDGVVVASLDLRKMGVPSAQMPQVYRTIVERARALPGVEQVEQADIVPIGGGAWNESVRLEGPQFAGRPARVVNFTRVGPAYFDALRIPFVAGRNFGNGDGPGAPLVAIVNESFVRQHANRMSPVGLRFLIDAGPGEPQPPYEIVGVVRDTKYRDLREAFGPIIYVAARQEGSPEPALQLVLRSRLPSDRIVPAMVSAMKDVHPSIAIEFQVMTERLHDTLAQERVMALLSGLFGVLAALMATIGLYGVMSYLVARRRHEIGIRMALGAERRTVMRMMLGETARLLALGLAIGAGLSLLAGRAASGLLFGLDPNDATTIAIALAMMSAVALAAGYVPAARAARLDPVVALRQD